MSPWQRPRPAPRPGAGHAADGPRPVADGLDAALQKMGAPPADLLGVVFSRWEQIAGTSLAAHAWPVAFRQGALVVAVDRPAWATEVRSLAPTLLARISDVAGARPERLDVVVRSASNSAARGGRGGPSSGPV